MKKLNYGDVMNHAIKVTSETEADVFMAYSGHIDSMDISIHPNGWVRGISGIYFSDFIGTPIRTTETEIHDHCKEMIAFIDANVGGE